VLEIIIMATKRSDLDTSGLSPFDGSLDIGKTSLLVCVDRGVTKLIVGRGIRVDSSMYTVTNHNRSGNPKLTERDEISRFIANTCFRCPLNYRPGISFWIWALCLDLLQRCECVCVCVSPPLPLK